MVYPRYIAQFKDTPIYDLSLFYKNFVPFTINSQYPIHRWYRFKEGFSKDLVNLILGTLSYQPTSCLDPFSGSGTSPLVCQEIGIPCHSIEVNPFLHLISKVKLETSYKTKDYEISKNKLRKLIKQTSSQVFEIPILSSITKRENIKKWLYDIETLQEILNIRESITKISSPYKELFLVILASILPTIGNTQKDGKCVRYKKNWKSINFSREHTIQLFFDQVDLFYEDIRLIQLKTDKFSNSSRCLLGNSIDLLRTFPQNTFDFVVTSPPYLNSFDYTDIYMPELWVLGFMKSYEDVLKLRKIYNKISCSSKLGS